ncbi:MAG: DUF3341 domain-containing protein [Candidatus Eisenbacteria bacterium]|nr:DUF3341 domain-containing protein [Candidatus Eisenbacteria bacterium]
MNPVPPKFSGVLGVWYYVDDAADAVKALRQAGHADLNVFSPVPHHELESALDHGPSLVRWVTAVGGFLGAAGGFGLCYYTLWAWPLVIGGKELYSLPPMTVIGYESMILIAGIANLIGMLALARLPQVKPVAPYDPRFQEDRIGVWVPCDAKAAQRVEEVMKGSGAEEVQVHA